MPHSAPRHTATSANRRQRRRSRGHEGGAALGHHGAIGAGAAHGAGDVRRADLQHLDARFDGLAHQHRQREIDPQPAQAPGRAGDAVQRRGGQRHGMELEGVNRNLLRMLRDAALEHRITPR